MADSLLPRRVILTIRQGADWEFNFPAILDDAGAVVSLAGHTVRMSIRSGPERCGAGGEVAGLAVEILAGVGGLIRATLDHNETRVVWFEEGHYDVETIAADGTVTARFEGPVIVLWQASTQN
jgi:hypothetical protein